MKKTVLKISFAIGFMAIAGTSFGQLQDEKNVTMTMDLQPILQLEMNTPDQVDFVFDKMADYYGGITKYGSTILKINSTVAWDLYAVGTSNDGTYWDKQMVYGTVDPLATEQLPLQLLELHQSEANASTTGATGFKKDYSSPFAPAPYTPGQNNIYASATPYVLPAATEKYIQGHNGSADFAAGGSYLTQGSATNSLFYYVIDYRIVPGLPAIFPTAADNATVPTPLDLVTANTAGTYAQPGVYTMNVKYVLIENQ